MEKVTVNNLPEIEASADELLHVVDTLNHVVSKLRFIGMVCDNERFEDLNGLYFILSGIDNEINSQSEIVYKVIGKLTAKAVS